MLLNLERPFLFCILFLFFQEDIFLPLIKLRIDRRRFPVRTQSDHTFSCGEDLHFAAKLITKSHVTNVPCICSNYCSNAVLSITVFSNWPIPNNTDFSFSSKKTPRKIKGKKNVYTLCPLQSYGTSTARRNAQDLSFFFRKYLIKQEKNLGKRKPYFVRTARDWLKHLGLW